LIVLRDELAEGADIRVTGELIMMLLRGRDVVTVCSPTAVESPEKN
jgi:hypothetical protein